MILLPEHLVPDPDCFAIRSTPRGPGAIAVIDLIGDVQAGLTRLYPDSPPQRGRVSHRTFGDFDDGVVAMLTEDRAQLCPHGGERVIERLRAWLDAHQIGWLENATHIDPQELFPEAGDRVEAFALASLTRAASPLALQLLLAQSAIWHATPPTADDRTRSLRLRRLLVPPRVVVVGAPNAGKSTLSNALVGRTIAIASPEAGTTRDYIAARIEMNGLVVDWFDTPGLRDSDEKIDPIERAALGLAEEIIAGADLLIALAEPSGRWPNAGRESDLRVMSKADLSATATLRPAADLVVCAVTGAGLPELAAEMRERLVPQSDIDSERPWIFDDRLLTNTS